MPSRNAVKASAVIWSTRGRCWYRPCPCHVNCMLDHCQMLPSAPVFSREAAPCVLPVAAVIPHNCGLYSLLQKLNIVLHCLQEAACLYVRQIAGPQGKLDVTDEQKRALQQALQKYRGELHALASERRSLNAVLAQAAAPGKPDSVKKVRCAHYNKPLTPPRCY